MSSQDLSGPSQPTQQTSWFQPENPASKTSAEESTSHTRSTGNPIEHRSHHNVSSDAEPSALASGDRGALKERQIPESDAQGYSKGDSNLDGEQMATLGEGDVARAVQSGGGGGHGEQESLTQDIDRQAADHEAELHKRGERTGKEIEEEEQEDWTGKKADIATALESGRESLQGDRPAIVLAAED